VSVADRVDDMTDEQLAALPDDELQQMAESAILDTAIMQRFPRWAQSTYDREDRINAECRRRSRGIWQMAWNNVVISQGHRHMVQTVDPTGS
jgi:hypothetical protein